MSKKIPLSKGKFAIVDDEDFEWLSQWNWFAFEHRRTFYAVRNVTAKNGKKETTFMHRLILDTPDGLPTDHIDRNGINNQRENLRVVTRSQNLRNSGIRSNNKSGYRGVCFYKRDKNYHAYINVENKRKHIGYFDTPEEAAKAYDKVALKYHGDFAFLNFPE